MLFRNLTMLLLGSLTASFVQAKIIDDDINLIMDDDINLVCDYYLIAVTTTFAQDLDNRLSDRNQHKADITYDVVKLVEGQLAPRLKPQDRGSITDTEIAVNTSFGGYIEINRQSGVAVVTPPWVDIDKPPRLTRHSCTSHSREALDNIITRHNRSAIKESKSDRKF